MQASDQVIAAARAAQIKWGIPASPQLAQWAIESGWGAHSPGNNPFGMMPRKGMNDPFLMLTSSEWNPILRKFVPAKEAFRTFPSIAAAFDAHAQLLATAAVYGRARAGLPNVDRFIDGLMPVRDAKGTILKPGYATDPQYAAKLKAVIKSAGFAQFDQLAAA